MSNNRFQAVTKAKEAHKQNIQKSLVHRLDVARATGDEKLIQQLEAEIQYFA